jgi:hypothetical protein
MKLGSFKVVGPTGEGLWAVVIHDSWYASGFRSSEEAQEWLLHYLVQLDRNYRADQREREMMEAKMEHHREALLASVLETKGKPN